MLSISRRGPDERTVKRHRPDRSLGSRVHRFVRDQTAPGGPHQRAQSNGHELRIIQGSDRIQRIFALTDLDARLPFCDEDA